MLQDTLVDSRSLCKNLSKSLHLKMFWRRSNSSQNLKLEKAVEMFILNNRSQKDSKFCQELYNLSSVFG